MSARIDISGERYGKLVALKASELKTSSGGIKWECRCDCGEVSLVYVGKLRNGTTKSCGCGQLDGIRGRKFIKHGKYNSSIYLRWRHMKQRCTNPNSPVYEYYGGRGITISKEWEEFENFYKDMGEPPEEGLTLERIDNDKGYSKENCRWATMKEQGQNRRDNRYYEHNGKRMTITGWANEIGIRHESMRKRLRKWPVERALTERRQS